MRELREDQYHKRVRNPYLATTREYDAAVIARADRWVPAGGGLETPFKYRGTRWLYCFNAAEQRHGYLNLDTDIVHDNYRED